MIDLKISISSEANLSKASFNKSVAVEQFINLSIGIAVISIQHDIGFLYRNYVNDGSDMKLHIRNQQLHIFCKRC